ncbi:MAG TPA: DUF2065 domain-containing protein [Gammaproteobacteria bacterium]|nr:DUF2065 domain-containing protein [Gammaproteobacteria bacterium]
MISIRVLIAAVALAIIFEGILPFVSPRHFRKGLVPMLHLGDRALRIMGLVALVLGVTLLYLARYTG